MLHDAKLQKKKSLRVDYYAVRGCPEVCVCACVHVCLCVCTQWGRSWWVGQRRPSGAQAPQGAWSVVPKSSCRTWPCQLAHVRPATLPGAHPSAMQVLGVSQGADDDEIKRGYRKAALRTHPDKARLLGGQNGPLHYTSTSAGVAISWGC